MINISSKNSFFLLCVWLRFVINGTIFRVICFIFLSAFNIQELHGEEGPEDIPLHYVDSCIDYHFNIIPLFRDQLPYRNARPSILGDTLGPRDSEGVKFFERNGRLFYHPVSICIRALDFIDLYLDHTDSSYLWKAKANLDRLLRESIVIDSALYFPYKFDYQVHGRKDALLKAPWFSGMAQGQILAALSRFFTITSDSTYLYAARKVFLSLCKERGISDPWVVFTDSVGCFWIEEYPTHPEPSRTLNGFIFAIYGVYDYLLLDSGDSARILFEKCVSTVKNYLPLYRRTEQPSFYGLTYRHVNPGYHFTHIEQLHQLYRMTGDPVFNEWAKNL